MTNKARFPAMLILSGLITALDRMTKSWFLNHYRVGESREVLSFFHFTLVHNTGTAFGFFQGNNKMLVLLSYAILAALIYSARGLYERAGGWAFWGVSLILGGALGNLADRHLYGHVIDFLDFRIWPVFNIADSAITVGAIATGIGLLLNKEEPEKISP
jgi:signal peptidase II